MSSLRDAGRPPAFALRLLQLSVPATDRRKCRQVKQLVEDRLQTQHREVSAWGVAQCGHRHIGMPGW